MSAPSWPPTQWPPDPGARRDVRGPARLLIFLLVLGAVPAVALFLAHRAAAGYGIAILENLRLDGVAEGPYELVALSLRLVGMDASPVRAVLRTVGS